MYHPFLIGEKIYLRALEQNDLTDNYLQWFNDSKVCAFNSHAIFPNNVKKMQGYFDFLQDTNTAVVLAIIVKEKDIHIGNISLQEIDWVSRSAEFAIILGEKDYWQKGFSYEAAKLIIDYAFDRLNLNRIYCGTSSENIGMQKLAEKLYMKKEGVRRSAMYKMNKYVDIIEYGLLRDDFKVNLK